MNNYFVKLNIKDKDVLFVRHHAIVDAGVSDGYLRVAKNRGCNWAIDDPENLNRSLYNYNDMPENYRLMVQAWLSGVTKDAFSCPYEYMALEPIRQEIVKDDKAEAWFLGYEYMLNGSLQSLRPDMVAACALNAGLMNMLLHYKGNKRECKKKFRLDWLPFVEQVIKVIKAANYRYLPKTYRGLIVETLPKYEGLGYEALLPPRLGNQNTAKVKGDNLSKDMMIELLSHPNQYTDADIEKSYNGWARKNNLPTITRATVKNKRHEYGYEITPFREGWNEYNKLYSLSIQRTPPTQPLFLIEGDDNHIDWWFVDDKNKIVRLKAYVVADSYKGTPYPLGWAFSENDITEETVRLAFLMAANHIKELTGGYYLPHETKTDRWGLASLLPFYEGLGHYYPTPVGSKNRGWLENFFGHADWKRSLKTDPLGLPSPNYTGNNISSKTLGFNQEALQLAFKGKQLPHISQASEWIAAHFERLRTVPINYDEKRPSRQEQWLEGWSNIPEKEKRPMTEEQFLLKLGMRHEANGGNEITKAGVQPTISGKRYSYAVPPAFRLPNIGRKVVTIYNPFDMSRVMITDDERLRFMAQHTTPVAGCMADMAQGGRSFLNQLIAEKTADVAQVTAAQKARRNRLQARGMDSETVLKLGAAAPKAIKMAATESYQDAELVYTYPDDQEEEETDSALSL